MKIEGLSAVCAGLGCVSADANGKRYGYIKSENCLDNLKDLQRFLRREHPQTRDVFKQLGRWNTLSQDLIPIIEQYRCDSDLVVNTVKVIVFLTMPIDPSSDDISQQMEYLWSFKASFCHGDAIAVVVSLLEDPLEHLECEAFTEDDWKIIQLVLTLFRNLLAIQDPSPQQMTARSTSQFLSVRDGFLEQLFHENVMDLLLALTEHVAGPHGFLKQDNLLLLETYHYIFWGQRPELVAAAQQKNCKKDNKFQSSSAILRSIMKEEEEQKRILHLRDLPRHSQFSGTFVKLSVDGSKRIVRRNPFITPAESILKAHQKQRGPVKRIARETSISVSSEGSVIRLLQTFANQFLAAGYNVLMESVMEDIRREHPAIQTSDVILFFQVAHFFIAYQRCRVSNCKEKCNNGDDDKCTENDSDSSFQGHICGPVASTMNEVMFNLVISKWHYSFDALKETNDLKSLSTAGALIKEMIHMLDLVLRISHRGSKEAEQEARIARILLYKVFYDHTEHGISHFLLSLIKSFDSQKQSRSDLADLVEMTHIMLRLVEALKESDGTLRVLKKSRKGRKKNCDREQLEQIPVLSEDHGGSLDASEEQNKLTRDSNQKEIDGIAEFHKKGVHSESHLEGAGHDINMSRDDNDQRAQYQSSLENVDQYGGAECMEENYCNGLESLLDNEDSSEGDDHAGRVEVEFDIPKFVSSFADNTVVRNYCWLLKFYKSNSAATNHYIIRMLQRICDDCMLAPMLYQLSLLCIFYEILSDQKTLQSEEYKNIVAFITKLLRSLFKKLKAQPLLFVEILFWKTRRECNYISTDQLMVEMSKWKNKEEDSKQRNFADALGDDEADGVNTWKSKEGPSNINVSDALGDDEADAMPLGEFDHYKAPKKKTLKKEKITRSPKKRKNLIFNEEQEVQIKELYEQHKESNRCSRLIAELLDPDGKFSTAQISRKLKQLGLKVASSKQKSGVARFNDESPVGAEIDMLEKSVSERKNCRKRQILDSEDESEDGGTLKNHLLKASGKEKFHINEGKRSPEKRKGLAFSKEQEGLMKELFERFKENKRCRHLIADALHLSAAQVSRKLKQLGLKVASRKRKSGVSELFRDKVDEITAGLQVEDDSENETLMNRILKHRGVMKDSRSDDGSQISRHENTAGKDGQNIKGKSLSKESDPETLKNSKINKGKKLEAGVKDNMTEQASNANTKIKNIEPLGYESGDEVLKDLIVKHTVRKLQSSENGMAEASFTKIRTSKQNNVDHPQVNTSNTSEMQIGTRMGIPEDHPAAVTRNNVIDMIAEDKGVEAMDGHLRAYKRKKHGIRRVTAEEHVFSDTNKQKLEEELVMLEDDMGKDMEEKSLERMGILIEGLSMGNGTPIIDEEAVTEMLEGPGTSLNRGKRRMNIILIDDN